MRIEARQEEVRRRPEELKLQEDQQEEWSRRLQEDRIRLEAEKRKLQEDNLALNI